LLVRLRHADVACQIVDNPGRRGPIPYTLACYVALPFVDDGGGVAAGEPARRRGESFLTAADKAPRPPKTRQVETAWSVGGGFTLETRSASCSAK
jgi:hypothetical protein